MPTWQQASSDFWMLLAPSVTTVPARLVWYNVMQKVPVCRLDVHTLEGLSGIQRCTSPAVPVAHHFAAAVDVNLCQAILQANSFNMFTPF